MQEDYFTVFRLTRLQGRSIGAATLILLCFSRSASYQCKALSNKSFRELLIARQ
jgi:hypothetical protein